MKSKTTGTIVMAVLAVAGALGLLWSRSVASEAVYPVEKAVGFLSRRVVPRVVGLWKGAESRAENVRLRREVASLAMVMKDNERLEAELVRCRELLGYLGRAPGKWIVAGVLSQGGAAAGTMKTIRVDKGSLAGVVEGAVVTTPAGLVGVVTAVSPHAAEILPITDPLVKVACTTEEGETRGILSGGTDELVVLRHLRGRTDLPPRSRVLTSGLGGVFPKGIEVGTLLNVADRSSGVEGEVQPAVDFTALEDVFIRHEN